MVTHPSTNRPDVVQLSCQRITIISKLLASRNTLMQTCSLIVPLTQLNVVSVPVTNYIQRTDLYNTHTYIHSLSAITLLFILPL